MTDAITHPAITRLGPAERLLSLDALRGFDMFWIVGADAIVTGLKEYSGSGVVGGIADQLRHKKWEGLNFEDLIFPLFVFLSGVALVFSLTKSLEREGLGRTVGKLFLRAALLFLVGIFFYGGFKNKWPDIRLLGVLQRIALSYLCAGLIFCFFDLRGRLTIFFAILAAYWALVTFIPVPGFGAGDFAEGHNLPNYIDSVWLPGRMYDKTHDPEGLLSALPAIATCLLGVFAGMLLKNPLVTPHRKTLLLAAGGALCLVLGYAWSFQFPVIKKIWTSSFVLMAGGYSLLLLSLFYFVIDVLRWRTWAQPFVWIGANALAIYLAEAFIKFDELGKRTVGGDIAVRLGSAAPLVLALVTLLWLVLFARFLYKRNVFVRL